MGPAGETQFSLVGHGARKAPRMNVGFWLVVATAKEMKNSWEVAI